jgi:hypothetical protein
MLLENVARIFRPHLLHRKLRAKIVVFLKNFKVLYVKQIIEYLGVGKMEKFPAMLQEGSI